MKFIMRDDYEWDGSYMESHVQKEYCHDDQLPDDWFEVGFNHRRDPNSATYALRDINVQARFIDVNTFEEFMELAKKHGALVLSMDTEDHGHPEISRCTRW